MTFADKIEDAKAKAAVKAQIEADKRQRAEKAAREKALREGKPEPVRSASTSTASPLASPTEATSAGIAGKDFKETRLQIRMASGGQPYTTTLSSDASACTNFFRVQNWELTFLRLPWGNSHVCVPRAALHEVAEFLAVQTLSVDVETVTFTQHFPR
jgi:UBX domain-containing protein 1/4